MELKKGIFLHNQLSDGFDAVTINSGTVFNTEQEAEMVHFQEFHYRPKYEEKAYVVKRDWRPLTSNEMRLLQPDEHLTHHNAIYVGEIPDALKECFSQSGVADARNKGEVYDRLRGDEKITKGMSVALTTFLTPLANNKPFCFRVIGTNYPNTEMLGFDLSKLPTGYRPEEMRHLGIHNDGKPEMTIHTAHKYENRICINLGKESRWFLFVNLSLIQAMNMLKKKIDVVMEGVNFGNIRGFFFRYFPDYPVIRIRQRPYQYYIAPTYNCFHDGSTLGSTELDITIIYFGSFQC